MRAGGLRRRWWSRRGSDRWKWRRQAAGCKRAAGVCAEWGWIGRSAEVQHEVSLAEHDQAAVQALVDLDHQAGIAEAVRPRLELQHLASKMEGVVRGHLAGVLEAEQAVEISARVERHVGGFGAARRHAEP